MTIFAGEHLINHTSAINVVDGCCAVHRTIEVGDNVEVVKRLINKDPFCVNIQEHNGFSPLHLAAILRRKAIIKFLIGVKGIDLYTTDLFGRLPEELVEDEKTMELIRNARTVQSAAWAAMCDEQIPLSTADGLSNWTQQFQSVGSPVGTNGSDELSHNVFIGATSASQDGVYEFLERRGSKTKSNEKSSNGWVDRRSLYSPFEQGTKSRCHILNLLVFVSMHITRNFSDRIRKLPRQFGSSGTVRTKYC